LNEILYKNRWFVKREKDMLQELLGNMLIGRLPAEPLKKAHITLIRHSSRQCDYDNLVFSGKYLIDFLKSRVIVDDNMQAIGIPTYLWKKAPPKKGKTELIVCG
jgi:hypothetical protein